MLPKRRRKRLRRKNRSLEQQLDISFQPDATGVDVVATYGKKIKDEEQPVITTRFNKELDLDEMEQISEAFFLGYTHDQFKADRKKLSESCTGWVRPKTGV